MTDLLERYLAAVARDLPEAERADISAELRDDLLSGLEAREARLGRPLTRDEMEAALVEFGHPLVVAGRYRKTQHLIGPEVFPFWWAGLRASLLMVAAVYLVLAIIAVVAGEDATKVSNRAAPSLTFTLIFVVGAVTLFCAAMERFGKARLLARWKPRNLPPAKGHTRSRFEIMVEMAMGVAVLLWWTGAIHVPNTLPGVGLGIGLAPVWTVWFWPILAYVVAEFGLTLMTLLRPGRVRLNSTLMIARNLVGASILAAVLRDGHIVVVSAAQLPPSALGEIQANFDRGFRNGLISWIVILLWLAGLELWRLRRLTRAEVAPPTRPGPGGA